MRVSHTMCISIVTLRLTLITLSKSLSDILSRNPSRVIPAEFTITVGGRLKESMAALRAALTLSWEPTSTSRNKWPSGKDDKDGDREIQLMINTNQILRLFLTRSNFLNSLSGAVGIPVSSNDLGSFPGEDAGCGLPDSRTGALIELRCRFGWFFLEKY